MSATKEQQAFDTFWNSMDEHEGMDKEICENVFKDGYVSGRKQALEEAVAICKNACYIYPTDKHRKAHNSGAEQCEKKIKELLNG